MNINTAKVGDRGLWSRRGAAHVTCAHRGFSTRSPENTAPAVEAAIPYADYVEIDVRTSADDVVVVMHDPTVERTTDVAARWPQRRTDPIESFGLHQLRQLDAGSWFGVGAPSAAVPTLHDVLELVAGTPCGLLVEVKADHPAQVVEVITDFRRSRPDTHVALGSTKPELARRLAELVGPTSQVPVGVLFVDQATLSDAQLAEHAGFASFLGFRNDRLTEETIARVHAANLQAMHNTNTRQAIAAMIDGGADATMSDDPTTVGDLLAGSEVRVIEAEGLVAAAHGTAQARPAERPVPYKLSGRAGMVVIAESTGDAAVLPLGPVSGGRLVCRVGTGPWGGRFTVALDDQPGIVVDSHSRSPARREVVVGDVAAAGEHSLHIERVGPVDKRDAGELLIDTVEVHGVSARR